MKNFIKTIVKRTFFLLLIILLSSIVDVIVSGVIRSEIIRRITDNIMNGHQVNTLIMYLCIALATALAATSVKRVSMFCCEKIWTINLENTMISYVLQSEYFYNTQSKSGEIFAQIQKNAKRACNSHLTFYLGVVSSTLALILSVAYVANVNYNVLSICLVVGGVFSLLSQKFSKNLAEKQKEFITAQNTMETTNWELIKNRDSIKFLNTEKVLDTLEKNAELIEKTKINFSIKTALPNLLATFGSSFVLIITLLFGAFFCLQGSLSVADLFAISVIIPNLTIALYDMPKLYSNYKQIQGLRDTVNMVFDIPLYNDNDIETVNLNEPVRRIEFKNISFSYDNRKILENTNLTLKKGNFYTLVGASGIGKSTTLRLLTKLVTGGTNQILIDDIEIQKISRKELWKNIFYMQQSSIVLPTTLRQNVICDNSYDNERYMETINDTDLTELMKSSEEDVLEANRLSAGQKQKIALARAFYSNCSVLLLDEPTSALDPTSEVICIEAIKKRVAKNNLLVLAITQRETFVEASDSIISLVDGKFIASEVRR